LAKNVFDGSVKIVVSENTTPFDKNEKLINSLPMSIMKVNDGREGIERNFKA
jgi:hypothetical protein